MTGDSVLLDWLALGISAALVLLYHTAVAVRARRDAHYALQSVNAVARASWVKSIMGGSGRDVLAVQTLRNSVMAASFMASTSILLIIGTLTLAADVDKLHTAWRALGIIGASHAQIRLINLFLLLVDFFVAFFFFSIAIRIFNHVGYMINLPREDAVGALAPDSVATYLNRGGHFYSLGMRTFLFSVPLVFWFFGPHMMVIATLALIAGLFFVDRAPGTR